MRVKLRFIFFFPLWIFTCFSIICYKGYLSSTEFLFSLVKTHLDIFVWFCFWVLYSIPLVHVSITQPVLHQLITVALLCLFFFFFFIFLFLFFFFFLIYLFIYLFMAVLGLRFCARAFSSCSKRGPLFIAVRGPLTIVASLVAEHRLQTRRLSSCGSRD